MRRWRKKVKEAHSNFKSGNATKTEKTIVKKMADGGADGRAPAQPKPQPLPKAQSHSPAKCATCEMCLRRQEGQGGTLQLQERQRHQDREDDRQEDG